MSQPNQFSHSASILKAFALEPILTPSGLIDGVEETVDATSIEVLDYMNPPAERSELDLDLDWESDSNDPVDEPMDFSDPNDASPDDDTWIEDPWVDSEIDSEGIPVSFISELEPHTFESGVFVVGESGEVGIDYLFDGGGYQGELAIFSLDGMDDFEPGSEAFIQEAARRAASSSDLGHVIVTDRTEGARFGGILGSSDSQDFNSGDYLGVQTVTMRPGDEFGVMLVPNGRVEQLVDNPDLEGNLRPLFSLATNNPNDGLQAGQIVDVTGDGNTFVFEDLRLDQGSDRDYNDIIFQVRGAVGQAELMENWIDPANNWRTEDLGQVLIEYTLPYIDVSPIPETDLETVEPTQPDFSHDYDWHDHDHDHHDHPYDFESTIVAIQPPSPASNQPLVGVPDTGLSRGNEFLDYTNIIYGSDWVEGDGDPSHAPFSGNEHGTHVVGVIRGVNPDAPLHVQHVVGSGHWADALREFVDAARESDQPNAIINLSFDLVEQDMGGLAPRYELTDSEWAALTYAHENQIVVVAAAGNDSGAVAALGQASQHFDNIITVGTAEQLDPQTSVATGTLRNEYSNVGNSVSLTAYGGTAENPIFSLMNDGFGTMAGTSVAASQVTGAASLVWATNPNLSYQQVVEILKLTATDLMADNWDPQTGMGLLNINAAVSLARATSPKPFISVAPELPSQWSNTDAVLERPVNIIPATFTGTVISTIGARIRSAPTTASPQVGSRNFGETVSFDAWTQGQFVDYSGSLGTSDNRWYRIAGTINQWISAAIIDGEPPAAPEPPDPAPEDTFEFGGETYTWTPYTIIAGDTLSTISLRTLGNTAKSAYGIIADKNGIANPNLIVAGATILVPRRVGDTTPGIANPNPNPVAPINGGPITTYAQYIQRLYNGSPGVVTQYPSANHNAIDSVHQGAFPHNVHALTGGTVRFIGRDNYGGLYVSVWNPQLQRTFIYLHFNSVNPDLRVGQTINAGDYIGNEGWTGYTIPVGPNGRHTHVHVVPPAGGREAPLDALRRL